MLHAVGAYDRIVSCELRKSNPGKAYQQQGSISQKWKAKNCIAKSVFVMKHAILGPDRY